MTKWLAFFDDAAKHFTYWDGSTWEVAVPGDYFVEVSRGNVPGQSLKHKFGRNDNVPNGSWEFVNLLGFTGWPLSAATTVRIKAGGDAADTAAGAGAQEVTVEGINDSGDEVLETIVTAGASASAATTASFIRVHRCWVSAAGTYGAANTGAVTIENSGGGTDLIQMAATEGQSQFAGYTIPVGKTGHVLSLLVTVDGSKPANIKFCTRANITDTTPPVSAQRLKVFWDGIIGSVSLNPKSPGLALPGLTDIWVEARGGGAGTEVSADFEILLIDD